jgi:general L-amino acid transport system permease protein
MRRLHKRGWADARTWVLQLLVLAAVLFLLGAIADTTLQNLDRLGVQSGFDFLGKRAGFDINQTLFHYSSDSPVYKAFAIAICNTLLLAFFCICLATLIGFAVALCCISRDWFFHALGRGFIETFRNIPALLQIFFWYYIVLRALPASAESWHWGQAVFVNNRGVFLPAVEWHAGAATHTTGFLLLAVFLSMVAFKVYRRRDPLVRAKFSWIFNAIAAAWLASLVLWLAFAIGWETPQLHKFGYVSDLVITPELGALILGLSLYNASFVAEVFRAGFMAVPKGQWEAARALGLPATGIMRHVIVPQAMRVIIPPMTTCYLNIFKATSLGAAVGYPEIVSVMVGTTNNIVGRPVEIMFLTFAVYSVVSLTGIWLMGHLNRRYNRFRLIS